VLPFLSTTISGNDNDEIIGITSTKKNWIVAGNLVGDFLGTTPLNPLGGVDSWVSAFDSSGVNVWSLRVGTTEDDVATAVAADSKEQIWVAGLAQSDKDLTVITTTESSSNTVEAPPIQTPTVQTLNPDTVTSENLNPLRKDLKFLTVVQIDKNGLLINRFATALKNFGYVTAVIPGSSGIYLIGVEIAKTGGERSFLQSLSSTGEFGPKFYFGKSATTLTSGVLNKDKTLTLVGNSAEVIAKKSVVGKVDGIILNVSPSDGKILKIVRSNGVGATRSWKSAAGNLTVGGTSKTKTVNEGVISQFSSTGSVLWSKRYVGATAAVNNSAVVAVLSAQSNPLLKSKAGDVVVYQFDKKGDPTLGGRIPLSAEIIGLRSQAGLGTCVATLAVDGTFALSQFPF
jgi:putative transposon-encoded protein